METLEKQIRNLMVHKKMKPIDIYVPLKINRINFYKAIKSSNIENKSLKKILNFLGYKISIKIKKK